MLKTLILLQAYGGFDAGTKVDVQEEDVESLITDGIAKPEITIEKHPDETVVETSTDSVAVAKKIAEEIRAELKAEIKSEGFKFYAQAKDKDKLATGPYHDFGEFAKAVATKDDKLFNWEAERKISGMSEGIAADGGFLIPTEWSNALLEAISEESVIAPRCRNFPVNQNLSLPFLNRGSMATSYTGGTTVYKPAEGVAKTTSYPVFAKAELKLNKMAIVIYATDELINDSSIALQTYLTVLASTEFAQTKDEDIIQGSGAGECLGVLNAPCTVSQAKETGQAADTIVTENIVKMYSRLYPRSRRNGIWLANSDCYPQLATLTINVGTGGAPVGLLQSLTVGGIATATNTTLLGLPLILTEHCQTVGTVGDVILGDFSQYVTITKAGMGMETATSIHLKFLEDETAFRFVIRFDGQPWWAQAITPKHSALTQSPFITLASRD